MQRKEGGKMWKYSEIIMEIDNIFDYFKFHNKNLTKKQLYLLADLQNLVHDLRRVTEK